MNEYTVEVRLLRRVTVGGRPDWEELSAKTALTTSSYDAAYLQYRALIAHEVNYRDRIANGERVEVDIVEWPEVGFGELLDYTQIDRHGELI